MEETTEGQIKLLKKWDLPIPRTKAEAIIVIGEHIEKLDAENGKTEVVKPEGAWKPSSGKPAFNQSAMYVSYAKDIFCALRESPDPVYSEKACDTLMETAINLVKQAKEAFE